MQLRVTWTRCDDLRRDLDTQLVRGGLFVKVEPEAGHALRLPLELVAPDGTCVSVWGEVLASVPGQGVAVAVDAASVAALRAALERCPPDGDEASAPRHERVDLASAVETKLPGPSRSALLADPIAHWNELTQAEKLRLAQHGGRDERAAALRDRNRALHPHVLKNPRITVEEVVAIAKNPQAGPDMLELIAARSEWTGRSMVAEAIVRNPRAPAELALRLLPHCSQEAIRQMAKGSGVQQHVVQAARKLVMR